MVAWNDAERSFDCPCHGSRFDGRGHLLHGPATRGLAPVDSDEPPSDPVPTEDGAEAPA